MSVRKRVWTTRSGEQRAAWIVDYSDQSGTRRIKTFERKREADAFASQATVEIAQGIHANTRTTVAKAGADWLATCRATGLEAATTASYEQHLRDHVIPFLGSLKLSELTVPGVRAFADRLRTEGRSPAMIRRVVGDLGSLLSDAQERGEVAQNVVRAMSKRKKRSAAERREKAKLRVGVDIPSPAEIRAIVGALEGRWRPLLLTAIFAGLRASELRGLTWADVDLQKSVLHVRSRADRYNMIGRPKSAAGERAIPMPPILTNTLREWRLACPKGELGLVFPTGTGEIEYHANIVSRGWGPAQVRAGVVAADGTAKYSGLHAARHFYASWCINRVKDGGLELPLKVVQHRLGHSSIQMTADTYGHLFPTNDDGSELAAAEKALLG